MKAGSRYLSRVDTTEVIVVKSSPDAGPLECGGAPMLEMGQPVDRSTEIDPSHAAGTQIGKRYVDVGAELEVLCTKSGPASLSLDGRALVAKDAKPLPSSD